MSAPPGSIAAMFPELAEMVEQLLAERNRLEVQLGAALRDLEICQRVSQRNADAHMREAAKVRAVELVHVWTNEDGKRFMFVDDVGVALQIPGYAAVSGDTEGGTG